MSGARPGIVVFALTAAGGGLAVGLDQPAGAWAGYGVASLAAVIGFSTLWQQRGLLERRAQEAARRRRVDLEAASAADLRHDTEIERARADLEHEQQYSALIQGQLTRAREQLERERAARRAAERELDVLTGPGTWQPGMPSVLLTVEEPREAATPEAVELRTAEQRSGEQRSGGRQSGERQSAAAQPVEVAPREAAAVSEADAGVAPVRDEPLPVARLMTAQPAAAEPQAPEAPASDKVPAQRGEGSAALRRGWQVVDGDDEDDDVLSAAEAERLYRPFIDRLDPPAAAPVSDAALAMAPVIAAELDGLLDLTAYDETVEFSVREIKGMA
ncbi:MAG: hypothetical protein ACRDVE_11215 [Actinocrinis sp.]